jgi:hypothetical protein
LKTHRLFQVPCLRCEFHRRLLPKSLVRTTLVVVPSPSTTSNGAPQPQLLPGVAHSLAVLTVSFTILPVKGNGTW